jgi:DNA polymerase III gamma/tau subunit
MPDFWQFPTVSMGIGPINAIYQARFNRYLQNRGIKDTSDQRVWAFLGDGEVDEVDTLGAIGLATRENLDNLTFVVNCNLQRLDGPVRGNGKIIQELESIFGGAGWNVIKVVWGRGWDPLLAQDREGALVNLMNTTLDGDYQTFKAENGAFVREHYFGRDPRTIVNDLVRHMRDAFLTQMAPELVQLPEDRAAEVAAQAGRLGTPRIVKIIETLGLAINDMRNAPDSRVVLEVALVRLVHRELQMGIESLLARVERLEKELENRPQIAPAPVNPSTGRAVLGGRVAQDPSAPAVRPAATAPSVSPAPVATPAPVTASAPEPEPAPVVAASTSAMSIAAVVEKWNEGVIGELKGMRRAVAQMAKPVERDGQLVLLVDNEPSAKRVNEYMTDLSAVIFKVAGGKCQIVVETRSEEPRAPKAKVVEEAPEEEFVDIEEIKQLPTVSNKATGTNLADAFPGSELLTEDE